MARRLAFEKNETLQKAMMLFWKKGYESSSMEDLVKAMEINRFSIYNTFGDKKALLMMALKLYRETVLASIISPLEADLPALDCLNNYFENMSNLLELPSGSLGCFIQRTGQSHIAKDPDVGVILLEMLADLRQALLNVIKRAKSERSISNRHSDEVIVGFIMSQIQGLILLRSYSNDLIAIAKQVGMLKDSLGSW